MRGVGEGIAFAALVAATAWLEIAGREASLLWVLIAWWVCFSDWGQKK